METLTYTLPSFWAVYLINDDPSGMEDEEIKAVDEWIRNMELPAPADCSEDSNFTQWHDAIDVYPYATDCSEYTFLIHQKDTANG